VATKANGLFFQEKEKRLSDGATLMLSAESHVPCFQERVGTSIMGYMIPDRLPWRLRARPSATLHEIGSAANKAGELVQDIVQKRSTVVKGK
jgi:hypothetical protein